MSELSAPYELLVGIDWGSQAHQVCLVSPDGTVVEEEVVEHNAEAIQAFLERLLRRVDGHAERVAVAIETPRGALVEAMVERGLHVYALNPKQLDRFRDRHTVAGAKDDRRDAYVLSDALRTDRPRFRRVQLDHPLVIQIRELSRADDDLRQEFNGLTSRLREQLYRCASSLLELVPAADEAWLWDMVERVTQTPSRPLTRTQVSVVLRRHRIIRFTAEQVLEVVRRPALPIAPGTAEAARSHIALLLPRLRAAHEQRRHCEKRLAALLEEYGREEEEDPEGAGGPSDVAILQSLPGVGTMVSAAMVGRASQLLARRDYAGLRTYMGIAPVTRQSGRSQIVVMRRACDLTLRNAAFFWSGVSMQHDAKARAFYAKQRARGHGHARALRALTDHWLKILMAMLETRTLYDPDFKSRRVPAAALSP